MGVQHQGWGFKVERRRACQALVQHAGEGVHRAPGVGRLQADLLWRQETSVGQAIQVIPLEKGTGDSDVAEESAAVVCRDEDPLRREIAREDAQGECGVECAGHWR